MKQVPHTDKVKAMLTAVIGDDSVQTDTLAVFETISVNTRPLLRRNGLHKGGRVGIDVLSEMVAVANKPGGRTIPLKIMHREGGLPTGRVIGAKLVPEADGQNFALHSMFYVPKKESELVAKIDSGVIAEVSVGIQASKLLCSSCGWDYRSEEAKFENIFECTCANDHKIGKDGTHLRLTGLDDWMELSLVDRGAADGAKILSRPKFVMGKTDPAVLAARGFDDNVFSLFASVDDTTNPSPTTGKETGSMDLQDKFTTLTADHAVQKHKLDTSEAALLAANGMVTAKTTELSAAQAKVTELTSEVATLKATDANKVAVENREMTAFADELLKAAYAATGKAGTALPEAFSDKIKALRECKANLSMVVPVGGTSAGGPKGDDGDKKNYGAFTTRPRS